MFKYLRWLPAVIMMAAIFIFSATPGNELPNYGFWDFLVKKGGHTLGYGLLALSYWYALNAGQKPKLPVVAWLLAVLYAATDEFHQSFTPGRHATPLDVLIYDNLGAAFAMFLATWLTKRKQKSGA
jgi:VanZ family protein